MSSASFDLIAIDLDGTLVGPDGSMSSRNLGAIREAVDLGVEVVIATGRAWIESAHFLEQIGCASAFIGAGGALLNDCATGRTLERAVIETDVVDRVTTSLVDHGHLAHVLKDRSATGYDYLLVGDGDIHPTAGWWFDHMPAIESRRVASLEDDPHPADTVRCGTVAGESQMEKVVEEIRHDLGDSVLIQHWPAVSRNKGETEPTHLLEIFSPRTDKWTMLEEFATGRGIPPERIAAIGDGLNDIGMVRGAGLGIAMGNASPGVLHVADVVVADHGSSGVAEGINLVLTG